MASREEDKAMAGLLRKSLALDADKGASGDCPEPEILAAYFERSLEADEIVRYDLHFSQCSRCREQLAAMARADSAADGEKKAASGWNWLRTPRWLVPTVAAFAMLVWIVGSTLQKWKATEVIAIKRPESVPLLAPETHATDSAAPGESSAPATPSARATARSDQLSSPASAQAGTVNRMYLRVLPPSDQKKQSGEARGARKKNEPAALATDSSSSAANGTAIEVEGPPLTDAQSVVLLPNKTQADSATGNFSTPAAEQGANRPGAASGKTAARQSAAAPAAAPSPLTARPNFAARKVRDAAEIAKMQQAEMSSSLAGFVVQTPDANVLWMVSDSGSVGRSEDGGANWKFQSLETSSRFVAGSSPTTKTCWLVGEHGLILRTTDGKTWTAVQPPAAANPEGFTGVEAKDELSATVTAADGHKFATADGGKTWTPAK
jgi:Photosynthesis system II assembly factor YCF48